MREIHSCLVCGNDECREIYSSTFHGGLHEAISSFLARRKDTTYDKIDRCPVCGFVFTARQFEVQEYKLIYEKAGRVVAEYDDLLHSAEAARGRKLARLLTTYIEQTDNIFDFGCGQGAFLKSVKGKNKFGFEVIGLPGHKNCDANIFTGDFLSMFESGEFPASSFDVVTAFDVLEHLPDLDRYLQAFTDMVRPGGTLFVTVPNFNSFSSRLFRNRWSLLLLEHLWYFTPSTLDKYISSFGWQLEDVGHIAYDVPVRHLLCRVSQIFGIPTPKIVGSFGNLIIPVPVGLMRGVFRKL